MNNYIKYSYFFIYKIKKNVIIQVMEKKFNYNKITGVHLELTTKCNAMCPMCNRNYKGKVRDDLPILELDLQQIKTIFTPDFVKQLKLISLCGVYGEPICNNYLFDILTYFYECNPELDIDIYTNGGIHNISWWRNLANIMKNHNGNVIFGIDGIGETHSLHRCNTNYETVLAHAKAYIDAGGKAQWDFIVFKHNEHQVEQARELSEKLGFLSFQVKKTSRFFKTLYENDEKLDSTIMDYGKHPVYDINGNFSYYIELPENPQYVNESENRLIEIIKQYGSLDNYFNENYIDCGAINSGGIFVSANGEVFPCCTVYQQICYKTVHGVNDKNELNEYNIYKKYDMSAINNSIEQIVNNGFFDELLSSFDCKGLSNGKPKSCSRTCGVGLNLHKNSHTTQIKYDK